MINDKSLVVVTGASSGIGAATAELFSAKGYPLLLIARRRERLEALDLPNALCKGVDVLDRISFGEAIKEAEDRFGPVDCLVSNAGIMLNGTVATQCSDEWDQMIDINLKGVLYGIKAVLPGMLKRKGGSLITVGSIAGRKTLNAHAVYCATKFGIHAFTETLREEVSQSNIRVMNVAPGMVHTELVSHTTDAAARDGWHHYAEKIGGALQPESIASSILHAYQAPQSVCVRELLVCPTRQEP